MRVQLRVRHLTLSFPSNLAVKSGSTSASLPNVTTDASSPGCIRLAAADISAIARSRSDCAMLPELSDFVNSTAAARLNGYLGHHGSPEALKAEIDGFGLSDQARRHLLRTLGVRLNENSAAGTTCPKP